MSGSTPNDDQIRAELTEIPGWDYAEGALRRRIEFKDFREAIAFLNLIAFDAEELDHHPDLALSYKRMDLSLSTHSEGRVTGKDFELARRINKAFESHRWGKS